MAFAAALAAALAAAPAVAGPKLEEFRGHIAVGYGKLMVSDAPGGSIAFAGGVDYPLGDRWRAGIEVGYWLLGTRIVEEGSLGAELDYSLFEASALAHWSPPGVPLVVSAGPGVFHARADLTSSGAAGFSSLAVEKTVAGASLSVTAMPHTASPVRAGLEIGVRTVFLPDNEELRKVDGPKPLKQPWILALARLTIHY